MTFVSFNGQIGFGLEKVIETAFVDASTLTHLIDADGVVAVIPQQLESNFKQAIFSCTGSAHISILIGK
jgi:hypothetical protein